MRTYHERGRKFDRDVEVVDGVLEPVLHRAVWGLGQGLVAAILLVSGGLAALQAASIIAALPFSVIMLAMCYSLMLGLKQESQRQFEYRQNLKRHDGSSHMSLMERIGPA